MSSMNHASIRKLTIFAQQVAAILLQDERIRILWLTGSLATGTADVQSDVDLRVAVGVEDFATVSDWWPDLLDELTPIVWKHRFPGPPDEAILSAITTDYLRFDLVIQSIQDRRPRSLEAAQALFDKDNQAQEFLLTLASPHDPYAQLPSLAEDFIRLLGMLPIVVEREDVPRARRLMEIHGQSYPVAFEAATTQHLWETLGLRL